MTMWLPDLAGCTGPKHLAIADAIARAVASGDLPADTRLPPQRDLAHALGLSHGTVTRAYDEARRRGLVAGEVGRGTYVRGTASPDAATSLWGPARDVQGPVNLVMNLPAPGDAAGALARTLAELAGSSDLGALLDHRSDARIEAHANAAAAWIGRLGLDAGADETVLVNGAQHGVLSALMATLRPGAMLLAEALTYPPIRQMARHLDLKLSPLDMDEHGILPAALDNACLKTAARVLYCMPTLQSPTGATMPLDRRREIVEIVRRHDLTLIEDDVFGFLPKHRPAPLAALAPERTLFVTSVSKSLAPGLRIGMVHGPRDLVAAVRAAVQMSCWMPAPLMTEVVRRWIEEGTADRLNAWQRGEMAARLALARDALGEAIVPDASARFHLWVPLPEAWTNASFAAAARERDVLVATADTFALRRTEVPGAVRLALGYEPTRDRLARGLGVVRDLLDGDPADAAAIV